MSFHKVVFPLGLSTISPLKMTLCTTKRRGNRDGRLTYTGHIPYNSSTAENEALPMSFRLLALLPQAGLRQFPGSPHRLSKTHDHHVYSRYSKGSWFRPMTARGSAANHRKSECIADPESMDPIPVFLVQRLESLFKSTIIEESGSSNLVEVAGL